MKKLITAALLIAVAAKPALAMSDLDKALAGLLIGIGVAAVAQKAQRVNAPTATNDYYEDKGVRALGKSPNVKWEIHENPLEVCRQRDMVAGRYFDTDGCASWSASLDSCTVVTKRSTNHMTLGRLFLACQKGG